MNCYGLPSMPWGQKNINVDFIFVSLCFGAPQQTDIHIKSFAGQVTVVDVFYSIHKPVIFSTEQLILRIEASRYVEYLKGKSFPFLIP